MRTLIDQRRIILGLLGLAGALAGQTALHNGRPWLGLAFLVPSTLVFTLAWKKETDGLELTFRARSIRLPKLGRGAAAVALAVAIGLYAAWIIEFREPARMGWTLHALAIFTMFGGALALDRTYRPGNLRRPCNNELLVLAVVTLVAVALRLYKLDTIPFGTWYDEAQNGLDAVRIIDIPLYRPIFSDQTNATPYYLHAVALSVRFLGETTLAVRLVTVLMGIGSVVAAWFAVRELLGPRAGLLAASLASFMSWELTLSRIGMYNIATALFAFLAFGFLLRGWKRGSILDFSLAGASIGLGLWAYSGFQLFAALLLVSIVVVALFSGPFRVGSWVGPAFAILTLLIVCAPLARFALTEPDVYFNRTRQASLIESVPAGERLDAVAESTWKHLQMFNYKGDKNGRHNLPGEPMLDIATGALFMLGLGVLASRARSALAPLLVTWIVVGLLSGILSLPFEAPQSLRSVAALPAVVIVIVLPLEALWRGAGDTNGRWSLLLPGVVAGLLALSLVAGTRNYFDKQANDFAVYAAHSTAETIAAELMLEASSDTDIVVSALYIGHPTVRFLTDDQVGYLRLETDADLPLYRPADRNVLVLLDPEATGLVNEARRLFPNADIRRHSLADRHPQVLYSIHLSAAELASIQGLEARYYSGTEASGEPDLVRREHSLALPWDSAPPLGGPFAVEMEGVLNVVTFGNHVFEAHSSGPLELRIDGRIVLSSTDRGSAVVELAVGRHSIELSAQGGEEPLLISWQQPDSAVEPLGGHSLYAPPVTGNGLLGAYFANADWAGQPSYARIDPDIDIYFHSPILERPYTVEWSGKIAVPVGGQWAFGLNSIDGSTVSIDGTEVASATVPNEYAEGTIQLSEGLHDIVVRYTDGTSHTQVHLFWKAPGAPRSLVPPAALFPPRGSYEEIILPTAAELGLPVVPAASEAPVTAVVTSIEIGGSPRSLATGNGQLVVADPIERRVLIFDETGAKKGEINAGADSFEEPVSVEIDEAGEIVVLDAARGTLEAFDTEGRYRRALTPSISIGRSRGIAADDEGRSWVAVTSLGKVIAVDGRSDVVVEISLGQTAQPIDVAVGPDGSLYVIDAGTWELLRLSPEGDELNRVTLNPANSVEGPQLTVAADGSVYLTDPSGGLVHLLAGDGSLAASVFVRGPGVETRPLGVAPGPPGFLWIADPDGRLLLIEAPRLDPD